MENLVSIIIPVYKVEPYLRRCLDSIVNQTYTNLEIILIDDGSPDSCPAICDEYAAKDKRIIVIHKENGGLSDARNAGLDICRGDWIAFVDSDDWVADCYVETMLKAVLKENADLAVANHISSSSIFSFNLKCISHNTKSFNSVEATKKLWSTDETTFVTAWGKLYRANLWKSIRFPKGCIHEDEYTAYKILYTACKTIYLELPLYIYFQRADSIMGQAIPSSIRVLKARWERYNYFRAHKEIDIVNLCEIPLAWDFLFAYSQVKLHSTRINGFSSSRDLFANFKSVVKNISKKNLTTFILKLFSLLPFLYVLYRKISPIHVRNI